MLAPTSLPASHHIDISFFSSERDLYRLTLRDIKKLNKKPYDHLWLGNSFGGYVEFTPDLFSKVRSDLAHYWLHLKDRHKEYVPVHDLPHTDIKAFSESPGDEFSNSPKGELIEQLNYNPVISELYSLLIHSQPWVARKEVRKIDYTIRPWIFIETSPSGKEVFKNGMLLQGWLDIDYSGTMHPSTFKLWFKVEGTGISGIRLVPVVPRTTGFDSSPWSPGPDTPLPLRN